MIHDFIQIQIQIQIQIPSHSPCIKSNQIKLNQIKTNFIFPYIWEVINR